MTAMLYIAAGVCVGCVVAFLLMRLRVARLRQDDAYEPIEFGDGSP